MNLGLNLNALVAAALVKKLKAASAGRAESAEALRELCAGNTRAQVSEWEELEERVRVGRLTNNDLMEVYDLKVEKGECRGNSNEAELTFLQRQHGLRFRTIS